MKNFLLSIILSLWLIGFFGHLHGQAESSSNAENSSNSEGESEEESESTGGDAGGDSSTTSDSDSGTADSASEGGTADAPSGEPAPAETAGSSQTESFGGGSQADAGGFESPAPERPSRASSFEAGNRPSRSQFSSPSVQAPETPRVPAAPTFVPRPPMIDRSALQAAVMENNPVISQVRKTGKISADSNALAKFGLREAQTNRFYEMSPEARKALLSSDVKVVRRLLSMNGFGTKQADAFFEYQPRTRSLVLGLDDSVLVPLLNEGIEEDLLQESLSKMNLDSSKPANMPRFTPGSKLDDRAKEMSVRLMEGGNGEVFAELGELSDGEWDEELLRTGEVADVLMRDYDLSSSSLRERISTEEALRNPFFVEASALFEQLQADGLVNGGGNLLGGKNLILRGNANALNPYFENGSGEVVVAASQNLKISGKISWKTDRENARLVVMSSQDFDIQPGSSLSSATSDLVLATQQNLLLRQVSLTGAREVAVRGMRDVSLRDVSIGASALATIKARRDLNVDGLSFNRDLSRIVMEATTMRLSNVNFPGAAQVHLNSLKGAIDGRYPNFGTSIPAAQQIGRVNFIENVRSGGNLLHDRPSFDLHGKNIEIGKIARP